MLSMLSKPLRVRHLRGASALRGQFVVGNRPAKRDILKLPEGPRLPGEVPDDA